MKGLLLIGVACAAAVFGLASANIEFDDNFNLEWSVVSGRMLQPKCVSIPSNMSLCHNIGYEKMRLPNLLEHDHLEEATNQAANWNPLIGIRCHPDTQVFLCSLFSPICLERVVYPCRSLCESVRDQCQGYMQQYGFPWPDMFECSKFPTDNDLCIHGPSNSTAPIADDRICAPCKEPDTYEGILHNYCNSDYVIRTKVKGINRESATAEAGEVELDLGKKKKKFYKRSTTLRKQVYKQLSDRESKIYIEQGIGCQCDNRIKPREHHLIAIKAKEDYGILGQRETRFYATFITPWVDDANDKIRRDVKKALRAIRKNEDICDGGVSTLDTHKKGEDRERKLRRKSRRRQRA